MKILETFLALALFICIIGWMFETDFYFLDILMEIILIAFYILAPLVLLIIVIWVIKELFN